MKHGVSIDRIIITIPFRDILLREVPELAPLSPRFMKGEAWVRHDEHYHVDFEIPAKLHKPLACKPR